MASAGEVKAGLSAAIEATERARHENVRTIANNTDIGVHLNTAISATQDAMAAVTRELTEVREAIQSATTPLYGASHQDGQSALMWLREAEDKLMDELFRYRQMLDNLRSEVLKVSTARTNLDETEIRLRGAKSGFTAFFNTI